MHLAIISGVGVSKHTAVEPSPGIPGQECLDSAKYDQRLDGTQARCVHLHLQECFRSSTEEFSQRFREATGLSACESCSNCAPGNKLIHMAYKSQADSHIALANSSEYRCDGRPVAR